MKTNQRFVFIPMGDEVLDRPELLAELVPYQAGYQLAPGAGAVVHLEPRNSSMRSPGSSPSSEALPALSSRTYMAGPALG